MKKNISPRVPCFTQPDGDRNLYLHPDIYSIRKKLTETIPPYVSHSIDPFKTSQQRVKYFYRMTVWMNCLQGCWILLMPLMQDKQWKPCKEENHKSCFLGRQPQLSETTCKQMCVVGKSFSLPGGRVLSFRTTVSLDTRTGRENYPWK